MAKAGQASTRLVERSRRAHDAQLSLLARVGRAALDRHDRVDSRTRSRVAQAESELDDLRSQALETVAFAHGRLAEDVELKNGKLRSTPGASANVSASRPTATGMEYHGEIGTLTNSFTGPVPA